MSISEACGETAHMRLVDENARVRQRIALAARSSSQQDGAHRSGLSDAIRNDVGFHQIHRVQDRQAGRDAAAGRIDVQRNVLLGVFRGEEQHLSDDQICHIVIDRSAEENNILFEQTRVNIECAFAARRLLHNHRD
jgi:hypothetical protein